MFHRNVDVKKEVDCYTYFGGGDSGAGGGMISYMFPEALTLDISFDANEDLPPGYFDIDGTYGNGLIKGVVKVSSGSGVNVWHRGILITVLQSIVFHEPSPSYSVDLCRYEEILSEEGWMDEQSEFPFVLVIRKAFEGNSLYTWRDKAFPKVQHIHSNALLVNDWFESFEGNTYSIRHTVIASVLRPWYAQTISVRAPLRLYRISVPNLRKLQDPVTLIVPDCGGKCVLELESRWIEIGGSTNVTVTLQNLKKPISSIFLMVIKCEFIEDIPCDRVVLVHRLLGWSMNLLDDAEISENAAYYEGYRSREDDSDDDPGSEDPVIRGAQFDFDLRFTELMDKAEEETPEGNEGQEVEYVNDTGSIASSSHSQRQPKPPNTLDFMSSMFPKESPIMPQRFGDRTLSSGSQQRPCSRLGSEKMAAAGEPDSGDDKAKRADSGKTLAKTDSMHSNNLFEAESMTDIFTPSFDTSFKVEYPTFSCDIYIYTCVYMRVRSDEYVRTYIYTCAHTHIYVHVNAYMHTLPYSFKDWRSYQCKFLRKSCTRGSTN